MSDEISTILILFLLCVAAPLVLVGIAAARRPLNWRRAIVIGALSEVPVALAAAAFISLMAECIPGPCPPVYVWERAQWWAGMLAIAALDGGAVAIGFLGLRWAVQRVRRAA